MKVVVLGAGVIGVTAAHYLREDGHEVVVIDRAEGPGLETSFANGGQISASHAYPWASPNAPAKILAWLGRKDAPLSFPLRADPAQWLFGLRFLWNCRKGAFLRNAARNLDLALESRRLLGSLRQERGLRYDERQQGILHIFRSQKAMEAALALADSLQSWGLTMHRLDRQGCLALEPALSTGPDDLLGGLHTPDDESGDAYLFTRALAEDLVGRGVQFRYGETVVAIESEGHRVTGIRCQRRTAAGTLEDSERVQGDAYVVALASFSKDLLAPLGISLPIYPAKGYSVTIPVGPRNGAPEVSLIDEEHKIVYSRLGEKLRVAGTAEFRGFDMTIDPARAGAIRTLAQRQFPAAGDFSRAEFWTGLRPLTPDGGPIIGGTAYRNLYLNTGHGTLGWTMACGSGQLLAEILSSRTGSLSPSAYGLERF